MIKCAESDARLVLYFAVTSWGSVGKLLNFSILSFLLCHMRILTPIIRLMNGLKESDAYKVPSRHSA